MLKKDDLIKNEVLKTLTPEQITAIETLSENDENAVIAKKTRSLAEGIENDLKELAGYVPQMKGDGNLEKYYEGVRRTIKELKDAAKSGGNSEETERLKNEVKDLTTKLKNNSGDDVLKSQLAAKEQELKDRDARLKQVENDFNKLKTDSQKQLEAERENALKIDVVNQFNRALAGKKAKAGLDDKTFKELIEVRQNALLNEYTPERVQTTNGVAVNFRDKEGNIVTNPDNLRNPFTPDQLFLNRVADLLHTDQTQGGAGTGEGKPKTGGTLNLAGVKTKLEAHELVIQHMHALGMTTQDEKWQTTFNKICEDNKVNELPTGILKPVAR